MKQCINCRHLNANPLEPDCPCNDCCAAGGLQHWESK